MSVAPRTEDISAPAALQGPFDGFRVEPRLGLARADIVLDRPPLNVATFNQRAELAAVLRGLDAWDAVRVIVIRSTGRNFSSGGDIVGFSRQSPEALSELARNVATPAHLGKPVITAIRGYCFGVGFELSLATDFRIVSETALLALPEQRIGMIPGSGGSARLLHMIGIARTKDVAMRSRRISGREAFDWGIAVAVVPDGDLETATDRLAEELLEFSPLSQRTLKRVLNAAQNAPLQAGIEIEGEAYGRLRGSEDFLEGVRAFQEKRKPLFKGR